MKKFLLLALILVAVQVTDAQDYKKVQTSVLLTKYEDAKTEIDKILADPKALSKAETWYWKSKVYAALAKNPATRTKYPTIMTDADEAFRKYMELDPSLAMTKEKGTEGFFDMYSASYNSAINTFNLKKWDDASKMFESSIYYINTIIKNKWTNANISFDTTSVLYAGYSYQNAGKLDDAAKYYSILADNKVTGKDYTDLYKFLANYYTTNKNEANFRKYVTLGRAVYPAEPWDEYEVEFMDKNYTLAQKTDMYTKEDAAGSLNELKYLQFGDVFANVKNKEKSLDSVQLRSYNLKAIDAFKKAFARNPQNALAAYNVGVVYYNLFYEYDDKYASNIKTMQSLNSNRTMEKDPKKKAAADLKFAEQLSAYKKANIEIEKPMMENVDNAIEWLEKSVNILKVKTARTNTEKSVINKSVDFLANLFIYKRDRMRGKDSKAFDSFEAKYKEYDSLHGKY